MAPDEKRFAMISGSSSGFGLQISVELAKLNWTVFASVRNAATAQNLTAAANAAQVNERVRILQLDVTDDESVRTAVASVLRQTGGQLDLLLNNAGYTDIAFFEDMTDGQCRAIMESNFFGALALTRAVLPTMRTAGRGRIGFVSSNAVNAPHPTMTMYAASKWALEGFAEGLAMELAPFGVEVVVMQLGNHRTPFGSKVKVTVPEASAYSRVWATALPGLGKLASIGAEPETAMSQIIGALTNRRSPFLQQIGNDTKFFDRLKRTSTYEARATVIRRLVGFPGEASSV